MKKIEIRNEQEIMNVLNGGRMVEGRLALVETADGRKHIEFKAYNKMYRNKRRDRVIYRLEHGWVKESAERIKLYESIPKNLGTAHVVAVMGREVNEAKNALIAMEVDEIAFG